MKKLLFVAALLVGVAALRAEPAAPLTAESQRAYFKVLTCATEGPKAAKRPLRNA